MPRAAACLALLLAILTAAGWAQAQKIDYKPPEPKSDAKPDAKKDDGKGAAKSGEKKDDGKADAKAGAKPDEKAAGKKAKPAAAPQGGGDDVDTILRPSTHPMFVVLGAGITVFDLNGQRQGGPDFRLRYRQRARVGLDFGYHFSGDGTGPALGFGFENSFDDKFWDMNLSFKFWYDVQVTDMGIYVAPYAKLGYALGVCYKHLDCDRFDQTGHALNVGLGLEGRLALYDEYMLYLRAAQVDAYLGDFFQETIMVGYTAMIGAGWLLD